MPITKSVSLIGTNVDFNSEFPVQITDSIQLRRASSEEIYFFENEYNKIFAYYPYIIPPHRFDFYKKIENAGFSWSRSVLSEENWRYWIVEINTNDGRFFQYVEALLSIINPSIRLIFTNYFHDGGSPAKRVLSPLLLDRWLAEGFEVIYQKITISINDITSVLSHAKNIANPDSESIKSTTESIKKFYELQKLPLHSSMYLLGLFSVIESLVTHSPRLNESLDSINHQLVNKLKLINDLHFDNPLSYKDSFPEAKSFDTLWKKLYNYRSQIAHTAKQEIVGDLQMLKSHEDILKYVEEQTKKLLKFSLSNHRFLSYLKAC